MIQQGKCQGSVFKHNHPNVKGHAVEKKQSQMIEPGEKREVTDSDVTRTCQIKDSDG